VEDIGLGKDRKPVHYHLIPGQGVMPLREIFKALRDIGYSGYYTVELYNFSKRPVYATKAAFRGLKNIIRSIA
jgi:sugar phosphate isomerase/epimerase